MKCMKKQDKALNKSVFSGKEKKMDSEKHVSKKDFRDNLAVEQFYKTLKQYNLREEAYKKAIQIYLDKKS